mgnify:CR=1 FL=1
MSGISKKYFNLDTKELREKKEREEKKIFRNKEAKLSSNSLNSFFNLFTPTPIAENVIKEPTHKIFKWTVGEVKETQEVIVEQPIEEVIVKDPGEETKKYVLTYDMHRILTEAEKRIPKKREGQDPKTHSDLYTDENPKGTIQGLGFKDTETANASVKKIENSGKTHAHKIQAAIAMEQRAKVMGKTAEAKVFRDYIEKMKIKTKEMNKEDNQERVDILKTFFERLDSFEQTLEQKTTVAEKTDIASRMSKFLPEAPKEMNDLDKLKREFRIFKEMVSKQMSTIGGGGSVNLLEMDDVDTSSLGNGKFLVFNSTTNKLEFTDQVDGN